MSDVLFKCWKCSKNLAVSVRNIGKHYNCPACEHPLMVPDPSIYYTCPSCDCGLCSPSNHAGEKLKCPNCDASIVVPAESLAGISENQTIKIRCIRCHQGISLELDHYNNLKGKTIDCPTCGRKIAVPFGERRPNSETTL